jgi:hypothetical protein
MVRAGPPPPIKHEIMGPLSDIAAILFTAMRAHDAYYLANDKFARTITIDTDGQRECMLDSLNGGGCILTRGQRPRKVAELLRIVRMAVSNV